MKNKFLGIIYTICIIGILLFLCIILHDKSSDLRDISNNTSTDNNNNDNDDNSNTNNDNWRYSEERAKILLKINEVGPDNAIYRRGTHPDNPNSLEINKDFLVDDFTIWDPIDGYELEFISYEELDNISDYIGSDGIIEDEWKDLTEYEGFLNEDGTFNKIDISVKKYDSEDWSIIKNFAFIIF